MKIRNKTKWLAYTALFTALTAVAAIVVQIPSIDGGYTNLSDAIIFMTAMLMDPVSALIAGGLGTFLADLIVYPPTMLWSLLFHGAEGLIVGILIRFCSPKKGKISIAIDSAYMLVGGLIMMTGYFFAKAYVYGTLASALISLWRNAIQVGISIVVANLLVHPLKLARLVDRNDIYITKNATGTNVEPANGNNGDVKNISVPNGEPEDGLQNNYSVHSDKPDDAGKYEPVLNDRHENHSSDKDEK